MVVKKPSGRACTMDVALLHERADPSFAALAGSVSWLAKELTGRTSPTLMVQQCLQEFLQKLAAHPDRRGLCSPIKLANGPISAAASSALTVGWEHVKEHRWMSCSVIQLDLCTASPSTVHG